MADVARAQRLLDLRNGRHLSQERLAQEVGVSTKSVRAWEKGGGIKWENARELGTFFKVDPESLVTRRDQDETPDLGATFSGTMPGALQAQLDRIESMVRQLVSEQDEPGDEGAGPAFREPPPLGPDGRRDEQAPDEPAAEEEGR